MSLTIKVPKELLMHKDAIVSAILYLQEHGNKSATIFTYGLSHIFDEYTEPLKDEIKTIKDGLFIVPQEG